MRQARWDAPFDKLIDEHIGTLKKTATGNERLNNSVIGLFSAMAALSQKT